MSGDVAKISNDYTHTGESLREVPRYTQTASRLRGWGAEV